MGAPVLYMTAGAGRDSPRSSMASGCGSGSSGLATSPVAAAVGIGKGISSHDPDTLREAISSGLCDIVLFAIGPFCDRRYVEEILPLAKAAGVGTVCFKTFGAGKLLGDTTGYSRPLQERPRGKFSSGGKVDSDSQPQLPRLTAEQCVHYTLTCDPDVALLGLSFANEQTAAFAAAAGFKPLSADEMAAIRRRAADAIQGKGAAWWNPPA